MNQSEKQKALQDILERLSLTLDEEIPLQGLGYNNVLFMATELILLKQEEGHFPLLLIEEPEAHLHPQLQMKLLKFIRENQKLQTILSTHSPNLASKAPLESIILMKKGKAYPMRKGMTKLDNDDYEFLEKFLDVTKSNLFFAKALLIVEGDAENILLPTIAELLGRPLENYGVSIVNVGSTANARYANIFLRKGENLSESDWMPTKVACIRDLDLWPEKADKTAYPLIGFKELKEKNKHYWKTRTGEDGNSFGTDSDIKKSSLESLQEQNVRVFVSEEWTLEYCLALGALGKLVFEAFKDNDSGFQELSSDEEERAIQIYGRIEETSGAKTAIAYELTKILKREFSVDGKKQDLREKLPHYIVDTLEYVTEPWPDNLDAPQGDSSFPTQPSIYSHSTISEGI